MTRFRLYSPAAFQDIQHSRRCYCNGPAPECHDTQQGNGLMMMDTQLHYDQIVLDAFSG
jgi:hypothetical protein